MKAVVYERYGSPEVLHLTELAKPTPTDDQILIKIHAVSLNGSDREGLIGRPLYARIGGLLRPRHRILGSDVAGRWNPWAGATRSSNRAMKCSARSRVITAALQSTSAPMSAATPA
jgi:hypothetical protein